MTRSPTEVREGTVVAGYRVLGALGIGGSGTVFRAESVADGSLVALKVLNAEHASNDGERQRFVREAEVVRQLAHPHVVALLDYGFVDDLPYLVFPLLEGRTLEARIAAEGKVGWGLTGRFSEQVLSALEVAHGLSIAHRDIKPANLFCHRAEGGETIRILDFGAAKIVGPKRSLSSDVTRHGALIGTPRYMAPEQVRGEALTPAADIYSFGLVMAEMLLGRPLVTGDTDFQMYVEQGSDVPHVLPDEILTSPFAAVIQRAVAKPLEVRYRLAGQMLADVRAILARYEQGSSSRGLVADLEVTRFIGIAPEPEPVNETAEKLRKAFNAVASKAITAPAPTAAPADPTVAPTLVFSAVPASEPPPAASQATPPASAPRSSDPQPAVLEPAAPAPSGRPGGVAASRERRSARMFAVVLGCALIGTAGGVAAFIASRTSPSAQPGAPEGASAAPTDSSTAEVPRAAGSAAPPSSPAASVAPPSAPPGAFTTGPIDAAPLARFLEDKAGKQTPEMVELALKSMADCEIAPSGPPTCAAWGPYEATIKRPMAKGAAKKRLEVARKYLGHASPSVRILAARLHASAKSDEDLDGLLAAAKVEPSPAVLAEMIGAMTRSRDDVVAFQIEALHHADERVRERAARSLGMAADRPNVLDALGATLASDASPRVKASACVGLAGKPAALPLEPVARAAREGAPEVRKECFAALTAAWVKTPTPRKEAYDATLAMLEKKPRDPSHLPEALGRIPDATVSFPPDDTVGPTWLKRATFYDAKKLCAVLEDLALDPSAGRPLRSAALDALGPIDGKKRVSAVRKKLAELGDDDSKALAAKPKKKP